MADLFQSEEQIKRLIWQKSYEDFNNNSIPMLLKFDFNDEIIIEILNYLNDYAPERPTVKFSFLSSALKKDGILFKENFSPLIEEIEKNLTRSNLSSETISRFENYKKLLIKLMNYFPTSS